MTRQSSAGANPRDYAIRQVFLQTGVRVSELCALTLSDGQIMGAYYGPCSCKASCPRELGEPDGDQGWCSGTLAFDIKSGQVDGTDVSGTKVVFNGDWPRGFISGNGTGRLYFDSATTVSIGWTFPTDTATSARLETSLIGHREGTPLPDRSTGLEHSLVPGTE